MKLAPDVDYNQSYGTTGLNVTQALGVYSALSLKIGKFIVQTPAIVLPNNSYDILIGTSFLKDWKCKLDFECNIFHLNGEKIPMFYTKQQIPKLVSNIHWVGVQFSSGFYPIRCLTKGNTPKLPFPRLYYPSRRIHIWRNHRQNRLDRVHARRRCLRGGPEQARNASLRILQRQRRRIRSVDV